MKKAVSAVLMAVAVAAPVGSAWGAARAASMPTKPKVKSKLKANATATAAIRTFTGPSVDMRWGPIQVAIVVQGKKILDIRATYPTERPKSQFINDQAVPMLRTEVLKAQGINNVYAISGATMTSEAYGQSLMAALTAAHLQ